MNDKINTYAELVAAHPWLDDMLRTNPKQAALMIYLHGTCDEVRRVVDQLGLARDIAGVLIGDDWFDESQPAKVRDA